MDYRKLAVLGSAMAFGLYLSACGDDSSSGPAGDEGKKTEGNSDGGDIRLPDVSGEGCDFKIEDKVWSYAINVGVEGLDNKTYRFYTYGENGSTDSTVTVTKGSTASTACAFIDGDKTETESESGRHVEFVECKDGAMYTTKVEENNYQSETRESAFETVMNHCKSVNNYDKDDIKDLIDSALKSSDSSGDNGDDPDEPEVNSSSSQVSEPEDDSSSSISAEIKCDFSKDDDVWNVSIAGVSNMTIEWTDNGPVAVTKTDLQMAELCETMASSMDEEGVEASCDGSVLVMKDANQYADASRDELYESFSAMCSAE